MHYPRPAGEFRSPTVADGGYRCVSCGHRTAVTTGTIFDHRRTPLTVWFEACWMFASAKDRISTLNLPRSLEIGSYPTTGWKTLVGVAVEINEPPGFGQARMASLAHGSATSLDQRGHPTDPGQQLTWVTATRAGDPLIIRLVAVGEHLNTSVAGPAIGNHPCATASWSPAPSRSRRRPQRQEDVAIRQPSTGHARLDHGEHPDLHNSAQLNSPKRRNRFTSTSTSTSRRPAACAAPSRTSTSRRREVW